MTQVIEFALLGLGVGAVYTLLAQGLVVIYRGSGILNFAQGAFAMVGAYVYIEFRKRGFDFTSAFVISLVSGALLGLLTHLIIMRRLRTASPLMRLISTLGLLVVLQGVATLRYGATSTFVPMALPQSPVRFGSISIPQDQFWLLLIAVVLTAVLAVGSRRTTFGLAISAAAENEQSAAALGWSPDVLAATTWALGSALAAAAGVFVAPLSGLSATALALLVIPAMATALLGGFTSFTVTLASGLVIGVVQSEMARYVTTVGVADSFPFVVMLVVLLVRGRPLPIRGHVLERLPGLGSGVPKPAAPSFFSAKREWRDWHAHVLPGQPDDRAYRSGHDRPRSALGCSRHRLCRAALTGSTRALQRAWEPISPGASSPLSIGPWPWHSYSASSVRLGSARCSAYPH